jgi:hypothetical protein
MELSRTVGSMALGLAIVVATVYAVGEDGIQPPMPKETIHKKLEAKEAQRRAAAAEQERRKADFARRCSKQGMSDKELEACRVAYRRL